MIQVGSKVRVARPGQVEFRGEVVEVGPIQPGRLTMVKVRPDPDPVTASGRRLLFDRWVEMIDCIEEEPMLPR